RNRVNRGQMKPGRDTSDSSTQTESRTEAHFPRLSEVNLYTLLSLWMEMFPRKPPEDGDRDQVTRPSSLLVQPQPSAPSAPSGSASQVHETGLVVVRAGKVVGLHCSGPELHAGQGAVLHHGGALAGCQLYFSRRPCATCLKMLINVGVSLISFWPGDPEVSILVSASGGDAVEEVKLDAMATKILKSNGRPHICVPLQPLVPGLAQFICETSRACDFMETALPKQPGRDPEELYNRQRISHLNRFTRHFLVESPQQHQEMLRHMDLDSFCPDPCLWNLRNHMRELVEVLASVVAGLPQPDYGFYREQCGSPEPSPPPHPGLSQDVARHCIIQARLLSYRTEDPKVGVGAVIWSKRQSAVCDGTGDLYLLGCGYNAYPTGSQYAEYPQLGSKQERARQRCKYRYIVHAEQNALTFMNHPVKADEASVMFVTKCPCDECVPLIRGAGITHIYTTDQDRDKNKGDISYLKFSGWKNISKFIWQRSPSACAATSSSHQSKWEQTCATLTF
uniref:Cytidine and dCMP deaminase domain-containing protein 1 n=1 Tax=Tetraodon nigroviridis TaxID=99883 RepID=H3DAJ7_TETNG